MTMPAFRHMAVFKASVGMGKKEKDLSHFERGERCSWCQLGLQVEVSQNADRLGFSRHHNMDFRRWTRKEKIANYWWLGGGKYLVDVKGQRSEWADHRKTTATQ